MEQEFTVVVTVSSQEHADAIQKDVENIVSLRTSIYHITKAKQSKIMRQLDADVIEAMGDAKTFINRVTRIQEGKSNYGLTGLFEIMYHMVDENPGSVKSIVTRIENILDNSEVIEA